MTTRVRAVGAVIRDQQGRLLLVQRGHPPAQGHWTIPGGRLEPGEDDAAALAREVQEETGLTIQVLRFAGHVERPGPNGVVFDIYDYVCEVTGGQLHAADDADDAGWFRDEDVHRLRTTDGLIESLTDWGLFG